MQTDELAEHLFGSVLGALDVLTVSVGAHFGLYDLLHRRPCTEAEAAAASGMAPRYAREWLEQQCVAGLVDVDDPALPPEQRTYRVSDEHAAVLCDPDSLAFTDPARPDRRRRRGAAAAAAGGLRGRCRRGLARVRRAHAARAGRRQPAPVPGAARHRVAAVADRRCTPASTRVAGSRSSVAGTGGRRSGSGWPTPGPTSTATTSTRASIEAATANAAAHGLADRVRFHHADAADTTRDGAYDLVLAMECVHDMADPVAVLGSARRLVADDGSVVVMDERVPDAFTGPGDPVEQLMYGISVLVCLPDGLSHEPSVGTGTVMRTPVLRGYARDAGFADVEVLPIEHDLFRFYRLVA